MDNSGFVGYIIDIAYSIVVFAILNGVWERPAKDDGPDYGDDVAPYNDQDDVWAPFSGREQLGEHSTGRHREGGFGVRGQRTCNGAAHSERGHLHRVGPRHRQAVDWAAKHRTLSYFNRHEYLAEGRPVRRTWQCRRNRMRSGPVVDAPRNIEDWAKRVNINCTRSQVFCPGRSFGTSRQVPFARRIAGALTVRIPQELVLEAVVAPGEVPNLHSVQLRFRRLFEEPAVAGAGEQEVGVLIDFRVHGRAVGRQQEAPPEKLHQEPGKQGPAVEQVDGLERHEAEAEPEDVAPLRRCRLRWEGTNHVGVGADSHLSVDELQQDQAERDKSEEERSAESVPVLDAVGQQGADHGEDGAGCPHRGEAGAHARVHQARGVSAEQVAEDGPEESPVHDAVEQQVSDAAVEEDGTEEPEVLAVDANVVGAEPAEEHGDAEAGAVGRRVRPALGALVDELVGEAVVACVAPDQGALPCGGLQVVLARDVTQRRVEGQVVVPLAVVDLGEAAPVERGPV
ncbi:cytochrome c oxidase subunit I [Babesia caballi]|uniref:Cytochrome c oxidase subunit I n=1 Tax=Babesia caballi TaxID=5871 RepID=A0AAV4LTX5_BABCB|nr:cytochrome c oxidase subunit I [Babesia caballi]